jgi:hypothetical protein
VEEQDSEEAEEEEADDENKLAVLNESHTGGVTVTLEEPGSKKGLCTWNFLVFNQKHLQMLCSMTHEALLFHKS